MCECAISNCVIHNTTPTQSTHIKSMQLCTSFPLSLLLLLSSPLLPRKQARARTTRLVFGVVRCCYEVSS